MPDAGYSEVQREYAGDYSYAPGPTGESAPQMRPDPNNRYGPDPQKIMDMVNDPNSPYHAFREAVNIGGSHGEGTPTDAAWRTGISSQQYGLADWNDYVRRVTAYRDGNHTGTEMHGRPRNDDYMDRLAEILGEGVVPRINFEDLR